MFDFNNCYLQEPITTGEILQKIGEYAIFKKYCSNFKEINKSFLSEFYNDTNPGCRIYVNDSNNLIYKDFGNNDYLNCFTYIQKKYYCTFIEALNIIINDFNLRKLTYNIEPKLILGDNNYIDYKTNIKIKSRIDIISQPFTIIDYNYWNQYEIPLILLQEYNVFSCSHVHLYKGDKVITFEYKDINPIYAYRFTNNENYSYKVYKPYSEKKYKWLFSGGSNTDIEGYDQLPLIGDILILTKSLKDCICYNLIGYPSISLQGESNKLESGLVYKLLKRFNSIIINYDNDNQGIKSTNKLVSQFGFKSFYIDDGYKDLSDYIKHNGLKSAKLMIKDKING